MPIAKLKLIYRDMLQSNLTCGCHTPALIREDTELTSPVCGGMTQPRPNT